MKQLTTFEDRTACSSYHFLAERLSLEVRRPGRLLSFPPKPTNHDHRETHDRNCPGASGGGALALDRKSTRLNSSHSQISYAVFCLKKKQTTPTQTRTLKGRHPARAVLACAGSRAHRLPASTSKPRLVAGVPAAARAPAT